MSHPHPGAEEAGRSVSELEGRYFELAIDMLCVLGFDGYFRHLNPAWERTLGFTRQELMAKRFIEFVHPEDRERTLGQNRDVRGGDHARLFENRYLCKDGSYRWLRWNAAPDQARQVIYGFARDMTELKRADQERERLVKKLQAAVAEVRTLRGILPICTYCKRIRDDENYWQSVEAYISTHTGTHFSHGICPSCFTTRIEPELERAKKRKKQAESRRRRTDRTRP
jgi:PAS domain S-box-containing protein